MKTNQDRNVFGEYTFTKWYKCHQEGTKRNWRRSREQPSGAHVFLGLQSFREDTNDKRVPQGKGNKWRLMDEFFHLGVKKNYNCVETYYRWLILVIERANLHRFFNERLFLKEEFQMIHAITAANFTLLQVISAHHISPEGRATSRGREENTPPPPSSLCHAERFGFKFTGRLKRNVKWHRVHFLFSSSNKSAHAHLRRESEGWGWGVGCLCAFFESEKHKDEFSG